MRTGFDGVVPYGQVIVTTPAGRGLALLWCDAEVAQGFAWDPDIVAFGVPDHDGDCLVLLGDGDAGPFALAPDALWAVSVPFDAAEGAIELGTVLGTERFEVPPGAGRMVFQARPGGATHAYRLEIVLLRDGPGEFAILRRGELDSDRVLSRRARRA